MISFSVQAEQIYYMDTDASTQVTLISHSIPYSYWIRFHSSFTVHTLKGMETNQEYDLISLGIIIRFCKEVYINLKIAILISKWGEAQ